MKKLMLVLAACAVLLPAITTAQTNPTPGIFQEATPYEIVNTVSAPITQMTSYTSQVFDMSGYRSVSVAVTNRTKTCVDGPLNDCGGKTFDYACGSVSVSVYGSHDANLIMQGKYGVIEEYTALDSVVSTAIGNSVHQFGNMPNYVKFKVTVYPSADARYGCRAVVAVSPKVENDVKEVTGTIDTYSYDNLGNRHPAASDYTGRALTIPPDEFFPMDPYTIAVSTTSACIGVLGSSCATLWPLEAGGCLRVSCNVDAYYSVSGGTAVATTGSNDLWARTAESFCVDANRSLAFITSTGAGTCKVSIRSRF